MESEKIDITKFRDSLIDTIERVKRGEISIENAKSVAELGQVVVNSAKVEVDFLKAVGQKDSKGSGFMLDNQDVSLPSPQGGDQTDTLAIKEVETTDAQKSNEKAIKKKRTTENTEKAKEAKNDPPEEASERVEIDVERKEMILWWNKNYGAELQCTVSGGAFFPCTIEGWCYDSLSETYKVIVYNKHQIGGVSEVDIKTQFNEVRLRNTNQKKHLYAVALDSIGKS